MRTSAAVIVLAGALWACGSGPATIPIDEPEVSDAGAITDAGHPSFYRDAGSTRDAGPTDSGAIDAGQLDAGDLDAGPADSGNIVSTSNDAGPVDSGIAPRADVPAISCTDSISDVYVTPSLSTMTDVNRGDLVRCAFDTALDVATVSAEVASKGASTAMTSGVSLYRVAFRTRRGDGSAGVSTARIYLPTVPQTLPLPVITIGHPTNGIADSCAPSMDATSNEDLALPWAGQGYAVIVPDYAGLGNEGIQSYLDNRDQGQAVLDGARALRKFLSPGALGAQVLAVGYSQGGGAVLSAQALASSYGCDGDLIGAIVFAPEWPTRMNSFGWVDMLNNPNELTIETGISEDVVAVMRSYAYFYNRVGATQAGEGFPSGSASDILNAANTLCETELGAYLQGTAYFVGDVTDPNLRTGFLACVNGDDAGCTDPARGYYDFMANNVLTADPAGAKVLYVQGLADYIMPAPSEAACNIQKLQSDGVQPQVCVDAAAQHQTVVGRNIDFAMQWGFALLAGNSLPTCSSSGMPSCTP